MKRFLVPLLLGLSILDVKAVPQGEIEVTKAAFHPEWRTDCSPNNIKALQNPQPLCVPTERDQWEMVMIEHDFQVAADKDFNSIIVEKHNIAESFFIPPTLKNGTWYWRVRINNGEWHGPFSYVIDESTWENTAPRADVFIKGITADHPRVLARKERLDTLRQELSPKQIKQYADSAEKYIGVQLATQDWSGKFYKNGKRVFQNKKFPADHPKAQPTGGTFKSACHALSMAYIATGDEKYAQEAVRWATQVAGFKVYPEQRLGHQYIQDDFSYSSLLEALTVAFDTCYELFDAEQRKAVQASLAERTKSYYRYFCNRLENRVMDNHAWQHTYLSFLQAAMALKGHVSEADTYLSYAYNIWQVRHPIQSTFDGGWNNGKYYGVNIGTWANVPVHFYKYTGHNYYDHPWYRNHPTWHLYRQAPGSRNYGFAGDGYEEVRVGPTGKGGLWLNILDAELDIPLAGWLASTAKKQAFSPEVQWLRVSEGLPLKSDKVVQKPSNVAQNYIFRDIGTATMNRNILNPDNNITASIRSAPWASFGHNHANQNAFTINHNGQPLFMPHRFRHGGLKHHFMDYRHSRGHNTVFVNGKSQPLSSEAYGWLPRFIDGQSLSYVCADANKAYSGEPSPQWLSRVTTAGINWSDQYGAEELTRFRRHMLFLRPSTVVIYDELEASEAVRWDWMLHCRKQMNSNKQTITVDGEESRVDLRASLPLSIDIRDEVLVPPFNVDGRGGKVKRVYKTVGTHAYVTPNEKSDKLHVLAIFQIGESKPIETLENGTIRCGEWKINAELTGENAASLHIENQDQTTLFKLKDETGASVLTELIDGKKKVSAVVDELPLAHRRLLKNYKK